MKVELDPKDPSMVKNDQLQYHVLDDSVTANAITVQDSQAVHTVLGVSPYSVPANIPLPQLPFMTNLHAVPNKESLAPASATEDIVALGLWSCYGAALLH